MDLVPLAGPLILQGGAVGLLALVTLMIFTGRMVPRRVHLDAVASERQRADDWKATALSERERNEVLAGQLGDILGSVRRPREGI